MATTNDAMFEALSKSYPSTGQTLGDLLYAFWSEKGLQYSGALAYDWLVGQGAVGTTLGDLYNSYFVDIYDAVTFDINDPDEWLELQVFDRYDTVEQEIYVLIW
ncbi:hypothetical protein UFOVP1549_58 [uncultured Caudovirales phage]|uniref:Uncharacterized protein n=1 Tax=uncultured Caudovirales phage TaxID=2100421 RepID=A0A6J5LSX1_9CAUD|nr:hypothetical protein UFOVP303_36 [uncultured Caudovirales phage]CAB5228714.1 hypothetical protein UFOVP1549_58 [uncultured Caudovirales phage]